MPTRVYDMLLPIAAALLLTCVEAPASPESTPTPPPSHGRVYGHGSGLVAIDVDFVTGRVTAARMVASTGYREFDDTALKAFRRWHFRPRTVRHVRTPITFHMKGKKL